MQNHYYTLGLSESASPEEIKAAFKRLAVKYHPDKHHGDRAMEEKFKSVNEAYQVLSDPYKKAQFDLQLNYEKFAASQPQTPTHDYRPPHKRYGGRPNYGSGRVNYKENNRATLYAFAITFGIALMVMLVKGSYDLYLQKKFEAFLEDRRGRYDEAITLYEQNEIRNSLLILADLAPFYSEETDMQEFRSGALEDIMFKGEERYLERDFENAVRYYELVEQFSPYRPMAMKAHLAQSYRYTDQPEKSIRMLKSLIESNYQVVNTLLEIAEVYDHELEDTKMAKDYMELARDVAVSQYESRFGLAYMLMVTEEHIPRDHYFLYRELAVLYNRLDEPERSLGATNWMKRIWKDSAESWFHAGKSYELLNLKSKACQQYAIARLMNFTEPVPIICN